MFQMWGKLVKNNHILQDLTVCIDDEDTRTHKVFRAVSYTHLTLPTIA